MSVVSAISQDEPISCRAYERLMAGESVSWSEILREHPMLGQITVAELVNAGVVLVAPDYDPSTGQIDFRLRTREAERVMPELARDAIRRQGSLDPAHDGPSPEPAMTRVAERKLKVIRPL